MDVHAGNEAEEFLKVRTGESTSCDVRASGDEAGREGEIDDKTEFVLIGSRQQLAKVNIDSLQVGDCVTPLSSAVKNLGSWFDGQLKMDKHINSICKATFFHLYNIRTIRKFLSSDWTQILANAFVTSRLDYCNSLLLGLPSN